MRSIIFLLIFSLISCSETEKKASPKPAQAPKEDLIKEQESATNQSKKKNILFFGNSLTAAYGLEPAQGFAGLIQKRIDSLALDYKVINAGLSGETTAGGNDRINWILEHNEVDIFILELGGNDALRGIKVDQSLFNLQSILKKVTAKYPRATIVIAGMEAPPNMGTDFTSAFRAMYPKIAKEYNASLIPFLLDKVGGIPSLNLPDGIHPNIEGHKIVTENIWKVLAPLL